MVRGPVGHVHDEPSESFRRCRVDMSTLGPIVISPTAVKRLVLLQSILSGLSVLGAASVLGDIFPDPKYAALFIVIVQAGQQGVNTYISKSVGEAVVNMNSAVARAEQTTEKATDAVHTLVAVLPPSDAASILHPESEEGTHGRPGI